MAFLLLAGCASPPPAAHEAAPDATHVTAIRVVPVNHTVDWKGALAAQPCGLPSMMACASTTLDGAATAVVPSATGKGGTGERDTKGLAPAAPVGLKPPAMERRAVDAGALFWRLSGTLTFASSAGHPDVKLTVFVTKPGGGSGSERQVAEEHGNDRIALDRLDIYLNEGERDLRFLLEVPQDYAATVVQPVRIDGAFLAQAFIDAGDAPVVLQ